jgi:hypothetical protein
LCVPFAYFDDDRVYVHPFFQVAFARFSAVSQWLISRVAEVAAEICA